MEAAGYSVWSGAGSRFIPFNSRPAEVRGGSSPRAELSVIMEREAAVLHASVHGVSHRQPAVLYSLCKKK
jgi:hypothetical protein